MYIELFFGNSWNILCCRPINIMLVFLCVVRSSWVGQNIDIASLPKGEFRQRFLLQCTELTNKTQYNSGYVVPTITKDNQWYNFLWYNEIYFLISFNCLKKYYIFILYKTMTFDAISVHTRVIHHYCPLFHKSMYNISLILALLSQDSAVHATRPAHQKE